jgi:adenylate kinase family enzyme
MVYKRVMIFGRPGSGKTHFAKKLANVTKLPLFHLDALFFVANWVERDYKDFLRLQREITEKEQWIIDGNSTRSLKERFARADFAIYFNYSPWLCLFRLIKRRLSLRKVMDDKATGCKEVLRWRLVKYMWGFSQRVSGPVAKLKQQFSYVTFFEIRSDKDLRKLWGLLKNTYELQ